MNVNITEYNESSMHFIFSIHLIAYHIFTCKIFTSTYRLSNELLYCKEKELGEK